MNHIDKKQTLLNKKFIFILFLIPLMSFAGNSNFQVQQLKWTSDQKSLDVYWLEDESLPTFDAELYFADGILGETKANNGISEAAFDLLTTGTDHLTQQQIASKLDYLAMSVDGAAGHESSTLGFSGLIKELKASTELFCDLYQSPKFPEGDVHSYKTRLLSEFKNIPSEPDALAERAYFKLIFGDLPYGYPSNGTLASVPKITSGTLKTHWKWMTQSVKKVLFLRGPKEVLDMKSIFLNHCGPLTGEFSRVKSLEKKLNISTLEKGAKSYFIPVAGINQVQIRMGKVVETADFKRNPDLMMLSSSVLGSGLTSFLMMEVRQKRGLTYGIGSSSKERQHFGYSLIYTSTKSESIVQMIDAISETMAPLLDSKWNDPASVQKGSNYLLGRQLRTFDDTKKFFSTLMLYYHLDRPFEEILNLGKNLKKYNSRSVSESWNTLYGAQNRTLVMVGDPKLLPQLEKLFGKDLIVKKAEEFL